MLVETKEPYVFPKHYNQLVFYPNVLDQYWWFVLRHDPSSKHVFENNNVVMSNDEDNQGYGNKEWYVNVLFWHLCCWCVISLWVSIVGQLYLFLHFVMLDINSLQPTFATIILKNILNSTSIKC